MSEFSCSNSHIRDAAAIARIYNEGIEDGLATFETDPRWPPTSRAGYRTGFPLVVVEDGRGARGVGVRSSLPAAAARVLGVADFSVYVGARGARARRGARGGGGAGARSARRAACWKLLSRIFPENEASLALCRSLGFREVGVYRRHAKLRGEWKDTVIVELLIGEAK